MHLTVNPDSGEFRFVTNGESGEMCLTGTLDEASNVNLEFINRPKGIPESDFKEMINALREAVSNRLKIT